MRFTLLLLATVIASAQQADNPIETARRIAAAERTQPWFWSLPIEGLAEIPYTYETSRADRRIDGKGKSLESQKLVLERIALDGGSFYRCLMQNDSTRCSKSMVEALDLDSRRRASFTAEDKARVIRIGTERRERRSVFWDEFAAAFRFDQLGPGRLQFVPLAESRPRGAGQELLGNVSGSLWYNEATHLITRFEYKVIGSLGAGNQWSAPGTYFSIELKQIDDLYLPHRVAMRRTKPAGLTTEESSMDFLNYRRFKVESQITFGDPK